jgi:translation initiation factor 4A
VDRDYGEGDRTGGYGRRGDRGRPRRYERSYPRAAAENPNFEANWRETIDNFDHMKLRQELLHGIYSYGFKNPSEIQSLAIVPIKLGRSCIAQAQSGTGKTGAFTIGILDNLELSSKTTQAIVLAPTRELADQIYTAFIEIGQRMPGLDVALFRGGQQVDESRQRAAQLPHVAVATPGRALDLIDSGYLRCENIRMVCLDEADAMLGQGFLEQVQPILSYMHQGVQILLCSTTIPPDIFNLMEQFMHDPVKILVKAEQLTLEGIRQFSVNVGDDARQPIKFSTLIDIYGRLSIQKAIIFANSKTTVDFLQAAFDSEDHRFPVSAIHGGLAQRERDTIMMTFRTGGARVLVSTDLLARGIDVQQITLVINFELPNDQEKYLHRIGRSGRYGRKGVAINLGDSGEMESVHRIE